METYVVIAIPANLNTNNWQGNHQIVLQGGEKEVNSFFDELDKADQEARSLGFSSSSCNSYRVMTLEEYNEE